MDDLLGDFIAETRETMEALAGEIVAWEADPSDRARLDAIFRFVHTVKGSCGFLDLPRLAKLSHAAEDVLAAVRSGEREPDSILVSAVLGIVDRIGELTDAIETGEALPAEDDLPLIAALAPGSAPSPQIRTLAQTAQPSRTVARSIRLPVELLDRMMAGVSDMVLARNELSRKLREGGSTGNADVAFERLSACIAEMRDAITRTRMARIENLFSALPRMTRDLSAELGKMVVLETDGGDVELDREMIEMIRDPLTHVVRNAIDHGIEPPEDRVRAGKPLQGRLRVSARQAGNQILIDASDDGRGIDGDRLVQRAIAAGLITAEQAAAMNWSRKLDLIFTPGLSTAKAVTSVSGRGVGMDVVRANVERIGGTVEVDSRPGTGLRLTMRVPLTLTIIPALTISCAGHRFAIPRSAIEELVRMGGQSVEIERIGGARIAKLRGERLPVVDLRAFMNQAPRTALDKLTRPVLVIVKAGGGERYALRVDAVHDHEELVVKPAAPAIMATGVYAGTTLPDNSRPMLLLDVAGIAAAAGVARIESRRDDAELAVTDSHIQTLLFRDLDGIERGVRLSLVERIEDVPAEAIALRGGGRRLARDGKLLAVLSCGAPLPEDRVRILRLNDGERQLVYAIDHVIDVIAAQVESFSPVPDDQLVAGVALIDGRQVEALDTHRLFVRSAEIAPADGSAALCLIADGDDWSRAVLAPLVAAAGYRVAYPEHKDVVPDVILQCGETAVATGVSAPVIRLRTEPDGDAETIYRYDRASLLDALRTRVATRS